MTLQLQVSLVNGDGHEFPVGEDFLLRLKELEDSGLRGKSLIHALLSDDWGAPPLFVTITGHGPDGMPVDIRIPYR